MHLIRCVLFGLLITMCRRVVFQCRMLCVIRASGRICTLTVIYVKSINRHVDLYYARWHDVVTMCRVGSMKLLYTGLG